MSVSIFLALGWLVLANVIGMFPSKHKHWPQAYGLIAIGLPILVWVYWQNGFIVSAFVLLGAMSVLRWPVRFLFRWLHAKAFGTA